MCLEHFLIGNYVSVRIILKGMEMLSINFNPTLLGAQNKLNIANNSLNTSLKRLSTGMRINSASDDAAGYYVSQKLNSQIRGLKQAQNNVALGSSMLGVAEGALGSITDMLNRLNDLALQGASSTMTDTARGALTKEANALVEEIKKLSTNTEFNGTKVFGNGSVAPITTGTVPAGYTAIYDVDDLKKVSGSGKYILMNDIDLSSEADWQGVSLDGGTFDGNGHVIKNLKSTKSGLFNSLRNNSTVTSVGLKNVNLSSNANGALANSLYAGSKVENCFSTGNIKSNNAAGGLVGSITESSSVNNCYSKCNVESSGTNCGGLVGSSEYSAIIANSYSCGNVNGKTNVGGLVGKASDTTIKNCYTTSNVSGNTSSTGILFGTVSHSLNKTTAINVYGNADKSTVKNAIGSPDSTSTLKNATVLSNTDFTSAATWSSFDSTAWNKSTYPPMLKDMPQMTYNFNSNNKFRLQVGEGSDPAANAMYVDTGISMGELEIDLSTTDGCLEAIDCIKAALDAVAQKTSDIGVSQSRLETISKVNTTKIENLTAAYSTVTEADVAEEVANFTKSQILAQTATSLITQTQNFHANMVLRMISSLG